jgi:hypothetical protein
MEGNLKYKKAFLIIAYGVLLQILFFTISEIPVLKPGTVSKYILYKIIIALGFVCFALCVHTLKFIKYWVLFFNICCFSFVLIGQYFNPGYHVAVIQFMIVYAIVFEGFPFPPTLLTILFIIEYNILPFSQTEFPAYPYYHANVINTLISTWVISVLLERYVKRVKSKQSFLDRKLRYKGIKTDLFLHELKNKLQPLVSLYPNSKDFKVIVNTIQNFNSFNDPEEMNFREIVLATKEKYKIPGECIASGTEDFFIDQLDLQTILSNLMMNSSKICLERNISLVIHVKNTYSGFRYEDNAGGMTEEQFKFFNQKEFKPYKDHEKNGLGLLLIKKLVEHHDGNFIIKRIPGGMRFDINY